MTIQKAKFLSLIITLITLFSFNVKAQDGPGPGHGDGFDPEKMAKRMTEMMKTELSLSNEQTAKVEAINLKYAKKQKELMEQMKALHEEGKKEVSTVLTKEQNEKMEAKMKEMKDKMHDHHSMKDHHSKDGKDCGPKKEEKKK